MKDKPTTFGLGHQELARLWQLGEDAPASSCRKTRAGAGQDPRVFLSKDRSGGHQQDKAELLRDRLAEPWPPDPAATRSLPQSLAFVLEQFMPLAGCCVGDLLLDPDADPSVIWQIKDRYKERARSGSAALEHEVATVIYYAAIASGLLFHEALLRDDKITTFSIQELHEHFSRLLSIPWVTPDLLSLFEKARQKLP